MAASSPEGVWVDQAGRGAVEIKSCGRGKMCGRIIWVSDTKEKHGCGQMLLGDLRQVGAEWDGGWIIDPDSRSKYDLAVQRVNRTTLKLTGYMGTRLFSKDLYWKKAPRGLIRCDAPASKTGGEIAAKTPEPEPPNYSGPAAAPAPERNPRVRDFADYEIRPPRPVLAVRPLNASQPAGHRQLAAAETQSPGEQLSEAAQEAQELLAVKADAGTAEAAALAIAQRFAASRPTKTCTIQAPFATVSYRCKR